MEQNMLSVPDFRQYDFPDQNRELNMEFLEKLHAKFDPVYSMMMNYQCAVMEVETKFNVLNKRLSIRGERNPIESVRSRIKQMDSILRKMERKGLPLTLESVEENILDVAGVRVICSFVDDISKIEECFLAQDDVELIRRKDYIKNPKPGGYRSLHLVVQVPIFTENGKKNMKVEVQLRTMAMEFWASLEHKLRYKKDIDQTMARELAEELQECAEESAKLDMRMLKVRNKLMESETEQQMGEG